MLIISHKHKGRCNNFFSATFISLSNKRKDARRFPVFCPEKCFVTWNMTEGNGIITAVRIEMRKWATPRGISSFSGKTVRHFALLYFYDLSEVGQE